MEAELIRRKEENTANWIRTTLKKTIDNIPEKTVSLGEKTSNLPLSDNPGEVEILQKIAVRENLIIELKKLLDLQNDLYSILAEAIELIKAIRFQTIDIIEIIRSWSTKQVALNSFLYQGVNYIVKLSNDLTFLDDVKGLRDVLGFRFHMNPLAYKGGGITDSSSPPKETHKSRVDDDSLLPISEQSNDVVDHTRLYGMMHQTESTVDGIDIYRLKDAEIFITKEIKKQNKKNLKHMSSNLTSNITLPIHSVDQRDGTASSSPSPIIPSPSSLPPLDNISPSPMEGQMSNAPAPSSQISPLSSWTSPVAAAATKRVTIASLASKNGGEEYVIMH